MANVNSGHDQHPLPQSSASQNPQINSTISIQAQSEELKYQQKYKELKKKVKSVELENDKIHLKVLQVKRGIQRLRLERAILYERLVNTSVPPGSGGDPGQPMPQGAQHPWHHHHSSMPPPMQHPQGSGLPGPSQYQVQQHGQLPPMQLQADYSNRVLPPPPLPPPGSERYYGEGGRVLPPPQSSTHSSPRRIERERDREGYTPRALEHMPPPPIVRSYSASGHSRSPRPNSADNNSGEGHSQQDNSAVVQQHGWKRRRSASVAEREQDRGASHKIEDVEHDVDMPEAE